MNSRPNQILSCDARKTAQRLVDAGQERQEILNVIGHDWEDHLDLALTSGWKYWNATAFWERPSVLRRHRRSEALLNLARRRRLRRSGYTGQ